MMKMVLLHRKLILSVVMISGVACTGRVGAQVRNMSLEDSLRSRFMVQTAAYPQEKIYVHTDKEHYISGDTLWLRAHVVNSTTHRPYPISRYVYADLIDPSGKIVQNIKMIRLDDTYSGYIPLSVRTAAGSYTLRAYTHFMRAPGQDYFPVKRIRVSDPAMLSIPISMEFAHGRNGRVKGTLNLNDNRSGLTHGRSEVFVTVNGSFIDMLETSYKGRLVFNVRLQDPNARNVVEVEYDDYSRLFAIPAPYEEFDVSFFPEGGYMLDGTACLVGFKALRKDGSSIPVSGVVKDDEGNGIVEFSTAHKGMGMLNRSDRNFNRKILNPPGYQKPVQFYSPKYDGMGGEERWVADKRTTLYWHPDIRSGDDGVATFEFYSADNSSTSYSVVIEGVTQDGKIVHSTGSVKIE